MSLLSIIALIFGTLGVILTIKQSIYCWPAALIAVVASVADFYHEKLYGDMALQVFYFFAGIYGWVYWNKKKNTSFTIKPIDMKAVPVLLIVTFAQCILYYYLLRHFNGDKVMFDAILTACSLTVTYMMTKKWLENWILWVLIDGAYVILYGIKGMLLFAVLYLFMTIIAFYGWIKWRKVVLQK